MSDDCFWYHQGKCWLEEGAVPDGWISKWIRKIPAAREGILDCAMDANSKCDAIPPTYIEWAEDLPDMKSARQENDEWQSWIRNFRDHHRKNFTIDRLNDNNNDED